MDYLSDIEKAKVEQFVADTVMYEAVRKVLLAGIYENGVLKKGEAHDPSKNFILQQALAAVVHGSPISDTELGQSARAAASGIRSLELGFGELKKIADKKPVPPSQKKENKAR